MAKTFHVNPRTLAVGECKAVNGKCPFGSADDHFTSQEAAYKFAESKFASFRGGTPKQILDRLAHNENFDGELLSSLRAHKKWFKNEKAVLRLVEEAYRHYDDNDRTVIVPLMRQISALHFAKEMLSEQELSMLANLEQVQKRWIGRRKS
jgi:hypothetical protein